MHGFCYRRPRPRPHRHRRRRRHRHHRHRHHLHRHHLHRHHHRGHHDHHGDEDSHPQCPTPDPRISGRLGWRENCSV